MNKALRAELGRIALQLSWTDRKLLDFVARHPFLSKEDLALVFGWEPDWARQRRNRLIRLGLMRLVTADEVGEEMAARNPVEVTYQGLLLVAAHQGLSLVMAVRHNGVAGGGPDEPVGARENLVRYFAHTLGVNAVCLEWYRAAQASRKRGSYDAVLNWQNSAACSRKILRPDGYVNYWHTGSAYGVFMEYDRGKMSFRDHRDKFSIYAGYIERRLYERDYEGMPRVLVITTNETAEGRIARAVQAVTRWRGVEVPVLITCEVRIHDPRNPDSLLGPIWRTPDATAHDQYCWSPY